MTQQRKVRVRFAPSPTGPLHIGGVRTALFNYLFARQNGGEMILRIEDTDSQRFVPGAEDYINEALAWLGIKFDEGVREGGPNGPYRQSERRGIYAEYVKKLLDAGKAYIAFDTPAELEEARASIPNFQYDASTRMSMRNSLSLGEEKTKELLDAGTPYVVRFKVEPDNQVQVHDLIRGVVTVNSSVLDDKVLYKSADMLPTYHLANIVDDHLMGITHVIRGEEWLPSAPLHVLLYEAFGWSDTAPEFVHLPLLLKPDGKGKLSKRDGDRLGFPVFPLEWHDPKSGAISAGYRESGYLPEAVINFLALLGWNPGDDKEIMDIDELISKFSFDHCSKSGAKFDFEKGKWFNHKHLQEKPDMELAELFKPVMKAHGVNPDDFSDEYIAAAVGLVKGRINFVSDLWDNAAFFFREPESYDQKAVKKRWNAEMPTIMEELIQQLRALPSWKSADAEKVILDWINSKGYHLGNVMNAFRLTVVGECKGPHMFDITELMGPDATISRIEKGIRDIKLAEA
ncbi:MAG: glutamate--tRNA ligase [Paramuribaculum sp.]|nr:glutamate--tRNA ligase [Paramuribaculum sp.]